MYRRSFLQGALLAAAASPTVAQQRWPTRPVRIVVPFAAGNLLDAALRQATEEFHQNMGQPLIIDNKPGGSGIIAAMAVANAPADGYTMLLSNTSMLAINPHTFDKLPYNAETSFKPVTGFLGASLVLAVNTETVPARSMQEFVTWVKGQPPEAVSYASFTAGNSSHFCGVILNQRAGMQMLHVPYNGTPPAVQALVGAQVNAAFLPLLPVRPHVQSGRVRVFAVSTPKRSALMPDVPTFAEVGFPDLTIYIWSGVSVPAGTPDAIIARLNAELNRALRKPALRQAWAQYDFEPMPMTPAEYDDFVKADRRRWAEAVQLSGFKANQ